MRLETWVYFDAPGEKDKLIAIMENSKNDMQANLKIQEEFKLNLLEANKVINIYNKNIKK